MSKPLKAYIAFEARDGTKTTVTVDAVNAVITRHKLPPVGGNYMITPAMIAEAVAIDQANGEPDPQFDLSRGEWD
jgi:hypothetical protein